GWVAPSRLLGVVDPAQGQAEQHPEGEAETQAGEPKAEHPPVPPATQRADVDADRPVQVVLDASRPPSRRVLLHTPQLSKRPRPPIARSVNGQTSREFSSPARRVPPGERERPGERRPPRERFRRAPLGGERAGRAGPRRPLAYSRRLRIASLATASGKVASRSFSTCHAHSLSACGDSCHGEEVDAVCGLFLDGALGEAGIRWSSLSGTTRSLTGRADRSE